MWEWILYNKFFEQEQKDQICYIILTLKINNLFSDVLCMWFIWKLMSKNLQSPNFSRFEHACEGWWKIYSLKCYWMMFNLINIRPLLQENFPEWKITSSQIYVHRVVPNELRKLLKNFLSIIFFYADIYSLWFDFRLLLVFPSGTIKNRISNFNLKFSIHHGHNENSLWWRFQSVWLILN